MPVSAALQAEWDRSFPSLRRSISFACPDGLTRKFSDVALCSLSAGLHLPYVQTWGLIPGEGADQRCNLKVPEWRGLQFIDPDDEWATLEAQHELKGMLATFTWSSKRIAAADYYSRVFMVWESSTVDRLVSLVLRPPAMEKLLDQVPRQLITQEDFPNLPKESEGLYIPIGPYGRHDSFGIGTIDGQIQPVYVDTQDFRYLVGANCSRKILHAYADGTRLLPTQWSVLYYGVNGRTYTLVEFTTDRSAQLITLDVEGYEDEGDSTGGLIANPNAIIEHILVNIGYNEVLDSLNDGWLPVASAPIVPADISSNWLDRRLPEGSKGSYYGSASEDRIVLVDLLNQMCESFGINPYFNLDNLLDIAPDDFDPTTRDAYGEDETTWIRRVYDELVSGPLKPHKEAVDVIGSVTIEGGYSEALGSFQEKLLVTSQETDSTVADSIQGPLLPAYR